MNLAEALAAFLDHLALEKRASAHTVAAYRRDLEFLLAYLSEAGIAEPQAIRTAHVRAFLAEQHRAGLSGRTLARRLAAIRAWFRYLLRRHGLPADPSRGVRAPKTVRRLPEVLDVDEAIRAVEIPVENALDLRDRAILELLYSSGLRLSELVGLNWEDLDLARGLVRVLGKRAKVRVVPVGRHALAALEDLAEASGRREGPVFLSRRGERLSARSVQARLRLHALRRGFGRRLHPHLFRHSCASHLLESSGDLRAVQELLGHADLATTQIYTHLDFQHLAQTYDRAHPRAKRKGMASPGPSLAEGEPSKR